MTKKISKLLLALLLIVITISSFSVCFADVDGEKTKSVTTSENELVTTSETTEETSAESATTEEEIHSGDLYLFENDIVMDKLVDGTVFIFGNNVKITGQVNGNLFVFANTVSFDESYVRYSIFACASSVYYNGACNDLYVATNDLEMTYDSYVVRDLKTVSSNVILKAAIGRDVDLLCNTIELGEGDDIPIIYGDLRYTSDNEITIPEGVISGDGTVTYTKPYELNISSDAVSTVTDILIGFVTSIVTVLVIYVICKKSTSNFEEKISNTNLSVIKLLKSFGIGFISMILVILASILLLSTLIGAKLGFILILLYVVLCLIAVPSLTIIITNILKPVLKIEKTSMFYLILVLVSVILHGIALIPVVGGILGFVIKMVAIGLLIDMYLPHKKLTDEEKAIIEEARKQAKEDKEKRKQEKIAAKAAKKQAKEEKQDTDL